MNKLISTCALIILFFTMSSSSCDSLDEVVASMPATELDCNGAICTEQFVMIGVQVVDASGRPVKMDKVTTIHQKTKWAFNAEQMVTDRAIIIDDSAAEYLKGREEVFWLKGYLNGEHVFTEEYILGADCCHVFKKKGKDKIVLD